MFSLNLFGGEPRYIRRARAYLQEARMSVLEHSMAAEHYKASADMYAERARRLEEEIALWEVHKHGAELLDGAPESVVSRSDLLGQVRIEAAKLVSHPTSPSTGVARTASAVVAKSAM